MAEDQIAGKTAADKRKALLALAADHAGEAGACLSPSAMAAFASGTCTEEEKQQALHHVSLCRRCYGEWLVLAEMEMEQRGGKRKGEKIPFYLKPANLATLVSAMAAVICIGLFLDINPFGYRIEPTSRSVAPLRQDREVPSEMLTLPADEQTLPADRGKKMEQPESPSKTATAGEPSQPQAAPDIPTEHSDAAETAPPTTMTAPVAAPPPEQESRQRAVPEPAPPPPRAMLEKAAPSSFAAERAAGTPTSSATNADKGGVGADMEVVPFTEWEKEIFSICRYEQQTGLISTDRQVLFQAGKDSLGIWQRQQHATTGKSDATSRLLSILAQANTTEQLFVRCREILATAGEDGK